MTSREQVMTALLAMLTATGDFVTISRRSRAPETITPAMSPALFLCEGAERVEHESPLMPPVRSMMVWATFYNDVGVDPNAIPETVINNALDNLDAALAAVDPLTGRFTLGGLVYAVIRDGEGMRSSGEITGKSAAYVSLKIILP